MLNKTNIISNELLYEKISALPFNIKSEIIDYIDSLIDRNNSTETKKHPKAGCMKGTFFMADDFDEPLECFEEYIK